DRPHGLGQVGPTLVGGHHDGDPGHGRGARHRPSPLDRSRRRPAGMPWKYTDASYREYTRTTWNASVDGYLRLLPFYAPITAELTADLLPREGDRILDLGTGPGEPALTLAHEVGTRGQVVGLDLSESMVAAARRAGVQGGVPNAAFVVGDCARLPIA